MSRNSEKGVPRMKNPPPPPSKTIRIAVRYKIHGLIPREAIVQIPKDAYCTEDTYYDACHDEIEEMIGQVPKWIRVLGKVEITPISYE